MSKSTATRVFGWFSGCIAAHQTFLRKLPAALYVIAVPIEMVILELAVAALITSAGIAPRSLRDVGSGTATIYVSALIVAPLLETLVAQVVPYELLHGVGVKRCPFYFAAMTSAFMIIHLSAGLGTLIVAGAIGGTYLANTYIIYREKSFCIAYLVTAMCHAMNNALFLTMLTFQR